MTAKLLLNLMNYLRMICGNLKNKVMNKICTTIEQSKKLIELGIDVNTADMYWWYNGQRYYAETKEHNDMQKSDTPAWSLSVLLELMPPYLFEFERGIDLNIYPNLNGKGWHCSYMPNAVENMKNDKFKQITNGDNPIDAAFEMVCWLLENKKI